MVALNFIKQFADDVESGKKTQTIRKHGKRAAPAVGTIIKLYTGMRTKQCRLLGKGLVTACTPIKIRPACNEVLLFDKDAGYWMLFDSDSALKGFSLKDGFDSVEDFFDYFKGDVEVDEAFYGNLITWERV